MRAAVPAEVERRLVRPSEPAVFTDVELDGLPDPVCRYLRAAIAPGTPLAAAARFRMHGQIKLGRWLPFQAEELLAPHQGFHWAAWAAGVVSGFDRYAGGQGQMRWRLLGLLPVMRADGPDLSRSAAGRVAGEAMWVPTALLPRFGVDWSAADDHHLTARWHLDTHQVALDLVIDDQGRLRESVVQRWGDPGNTGTYDLHPCGGQVTAYATLGGVSVPGAGRAGWCYGTDRWTEGVFFRYQLTSMELVTRPRPELPPGAPPIPARPPAGGWIPSVGRPLRASSQAITELEFHISPPRARHGPRPGSAGPRPAGPRYGRAAHGTTGEGPAIERHLGAQP